MRLGIRLSSMRHYLVAAATATAIVLAAVSASAQALYGSLVGNVTDPQGAVLPGVTLAVTNTDTAFKAEVVSGADGMYAFRNLLPGTYELTAKLSGFRSYRQADIAVSAGNPVRINIAMALGQLAEVVDVAGRTTALQTEKSDRHTEFGSNEFRNLPLNQYRNYQALINFVPGATPAQFQNAEIDTPGRSLRTWINGTQPNSNATRIDGAVSVNIWLPHHVGYVQPAETIETVTVSTNNFDADQGMAGGAATTVVTKSGTNDLHGSAFEFRSQDELNSNSFFNKAFGIAKSPLSQDIYGGTLGGPIKRNRLFYFGSWERYHARRGFTQTFAVPTAKMRAGDFSEVAAAYSAFRLYNPLTGGAGGVGRDQFTDFAIPGGLISPVAKAIMEYFPLPNSPDLNSNQLLDDYRRARETQVDRDNYDAKLTWQRTATHSVFGRFGMLNADVVDNFQLGFDDGSLGHTRVYVGTFGHTWTFGRSLVLDGNFGFDIQNQQVTGPDFGNNLGLNLGVKGTNDPNDIRASGLPNFQAGYTIGTTPNWMPLFRRERSYTFSSALTKVLTKHELRMGVDVVRHELNHRQAEFGDYGLRGGFNFSGNTTGAPGYVPLDTAARPWNKFAGFLMGLPSFFSKDVQTEEMTGREWQHALYANDRWRLDRNTTVNAGLRMEIYPLMTRADRGLERLDYNTYEVLIGGKGGVPKDVGINLKKTYFVPRLGVTHRLSENSVVRAGYGRTINPLPWSRPMRGSFPQDVTFNRTAEQFFWVGTIADGIPAVPIPDISTGRVKLPQNVFMRSPNPNQVNRAVIQQWNVAYEYRLPWDISAEIAYVGTRTDGGYADLNINYGTPGGGQKARQYFNVAGSTTINDWAARTRSRYNSLQIALNRPFRQRVGIKGAYTLSRAKNMADEDGWVGLDYNSPLVYDQNFALAGFDRTHVFQLAMSWVLPFLEKSSSVAGRVLGGWQLNGDFSAFSGTPYSIGGTNTALDCQGCGSIRINISGDPNPTGKTGCGVADCSDSVAYYPTNLFSQPTGVGVEGFGNSGRNRFRRPPVWNADLSIFKAFKVGHVTPSIRIGVANVFNHVNWGAPVTDVTANNFMKFIPGSADPVGVPGPRTVNIGFRLQF